MDRIEAYDDRAMRKSTRIAAIIFGAGLMVFGLFTSVKYSAVVGAILLLATVMQKKTYVTAQGIDIEYDFIVHKHIISWSFEEITDIHIEEVKDRRFLVLYFLKDVMTRRLVFRKSELDDVLELARAQNEKIHVEYVD